MPFYVPKQSLLCVNQQKQMDCPPEYNRTMQDFTEKDSSSKTTEIQAAREANLTSDQKELLVTLKIELIYIKPDKQDTQGGREERTSCLKTGTNLSVLNKNGKHRI